MNRIFKVIYSKVKHMLVVVSELTHAASKTGTHAVSSKVVVSLFSLLVAVNFNLSYASQINWGQLHAIYENGILLDVNPNNYFTEAHSGGDKGTSTSSSNNTYYTRNYLFQDTDGKGSVK